MDENMTEEIFALNNSIRNKKVSEATQNIIAEMKNNSKTVVSGTNLIIAMNMRIADHCTNIAESIYYD
jgi:phosphate transport system protein